MNRKKNGKKLVKTRHTVHKPPVKSEINRRLGIPIYDILEALPKTIRKRSPVHSVQPSLGHLFRHPNQTKLNRRKKERNRRKKESRVKILLTKKRAPKSLLYLYMPSKNIYESRGLRKNGGGSRRRRTCDLLSPIRFLV